MDELQSGPSRLGLLATGTSTVVWFTGADGSVNRPNPSWEAFTGQTLSEYSGWGWLDALHPDDRERVLAAWRAVSAGDDGPAFDTSYRLRRRDGEYRHMRSQGTPVREGGVVREWVGACVDVTERMSTEAALKASERRYRFLDRLGQAARPLTEPSEVMAVMTRMLGEFLHATRCAYADVHPDGDHFTIRGDWAVPGISVGAGTYSLSAFGAAMVERLRQGKPLVLRDVGAELDGFDGREAFASLGIRSLICPALVKGGRLVAMMAVQQATPRDWTPDEIALVEEVADRCWTHIERVRDAAARDRALLTLEMAVQAADLVLAEIDYRTNLNHLSGELARLLELGDGPVTVPREAIFERIHPEDRERYLEGIRRTLDPEGSHLLAIDVRGLLPSGTLRWIHIRLKVTFAMIDGRLQPDRGFCAARDITAELQARREMHEARRLAESIIENAGALVYAKDLEGHYIFSNQAWRALFGYTASPATGPTDLQMFGAEAAGKLRANDAEVARTGQAQVVEEKVQLGGRQVTFRSSKFPLHDDAGRIYAVCGVSTDITDVVEADRRKDEFIATLAHELRNPLAPIRNGLEILKRTPDLPPGAARIRDVMDRQLAHLVRLVDDLLDVSRITRDKLEMRFEPLSLQHVVDHAVETSRPAIDAARHSLTLDLPVAPLRVRGDLTRLAQVVSNLLNNAAKYTPPGGHIHVAATAEDGDAVLTVTDDGAGMSREMMPHVFDLFSQVDRTVHRSQGGLGIGLWLVRKLVEMHHGTITASSEGLGKGSTFVVRLPLRAP